MTRRSESECSLASIKGSCPRAGAAINTGVPRAPQVFIHDPLYKWALTPLGMQQRQKDDLAIDVDAATTTAADRGLPPAANEAAVGGAAASVSDGSGLANADAERALLKVKQKLEGLEAGAASVFRSLIAAAPPRNDGGSFMCTVIAALD